MSDLLGSLMVGFAVLMAGFCVGFIAGNKDAEETITAFKDAQLQQVIDKYEERIKTEQTQRQNAERTTQERLRSLNNLSAELDSLRMQLKAARAASDRQQSATVHRSNTTGAAQCGWDDKMEKLINRASDLVAERDRIAIDYNTLREQCKLPPRHQVN